MKIHKMLLTFLICMISFAVFSNTSEPKQKQETTISKDFVKAVSFVNVENVKEITFLNVEVFSNENAKITETKKTTEKHILDVGWQSKNIYNCKNIKNKFQNKLLPDLIRSHCN